MYGRFILWMLDWHMCLNQSWLVVCIGMQKRYPWPRGTVKELMTWEKGVNETPWRVWKLALRGKFCLTILWPGICDKVSWEGDQGRASERDFVNRSHPSPCLTGFFTNTDTYILIIQSSLILPLMPRTKVRLRYLSLLMSVCKNSIHPNLLIWMIWQNDMFSWHVL